MATHIEQTFSIRTSKHLLNSAGILRFPGYQLDMVRLGSSLYGIGVPLAEQNLTIAGTLQTIISQIKVVPQRSNHWQLRCNAA